MNNLYLQEQVVKLKMQEDQREMEQACLLREAGPLGPSWLSRAAKVLRNVLEAWSKRSQDHASIEPQSYQSDELAP